jgi:hypothetical protein
MTSSWVMASAMSRPERSLNLPSSASICCQRPLSFHQVGRVDHRHQHLLTADRVDLLADDILNLIQEARRARGR